WGIDCQIFNPPVDCRFRVTNKAKAVLSVGRFAAMKKQLEMVTVFRHLGDLHAGGWHFSCAVGVGQAADFHRYFEKVRSLGAAPHVRILADLERAKLNGLYEEASIFWHAGYGVDENCKPLLAEHFGIVTVEAMAAGCVPVVVNKGGQPEIIQHGV